MSSKVKCKTCFGSEVEDLVLSAQKGDKEALDELIRIFSTAIKNAALSYNIASLDNDDLSQEGMLGFLSAVFSYRKGTGASFTTYANVCIENSIKSALRAATRQKHAILNNALPLEPLQSRATDKGNPEERYIAKENSEFLTEFLFHDLSEIERKALSFYLAGYDYSEIASTLGLTVKSVDNALQRVRRKLRKRKQKH
ncbi:MAG: sigma-70 family RNA polymerase sigma factor [Clostridiales bacterium]|nr:sigma-70 family RNA polymerase sigma factor [Clostridiales bacterium]HOJ35243.1 sigma-70 family RNA polymerase sigma factor [Clostridiales bacterium]HOL79527.1 sigma-70 family RNA polymerase sigma factor [Clostridiales bacterium]HPP68909.1 sigma-70 family RNA polymerase sigma factor [Clostridiales bacterium]HQD72712.1 sigma-70 family RNA polymerase sigma factor [Clostridiales bacterium]